MSNQNAEVVSVRIIPNEKGNPPGKLADAEVIFGAEAGPLSGMKLIGFAIFGWAASGGAAWRLTICSASWISITSAPPGPSVSIIIAMRRLF